MLWRDRPEPGRPEDQIHQCASHCASQGPLPPNGHGTWVCELHPHSRGGAGDRQGVPSLPSFVTSAVWLPREADGGPSVPVPVPVPVPHYSPSPYPGLTGLVHLGDAEAGEAKEQDRNEGEQ